MPHLTGYDAWQLDTALAVRYNAIEQENQSEQLHTVLQYIKALMKVMGAKGVKMEKFKRTIITESDDKDDNEIPELSDILNSLGGK